jgi:hypothetical protein
MSGIVPMIASANARVVGETLLVLPDPERVSGDPIFRPGVSHHPTSTLILLEVQAIAPPLARCHAGRNVQLPRRRHTPVDLVLTRESGVVAGCGANFKKRASPCYVVLNLMQPEQSDLFPEQKKTVARLAQMIKEESK